MVLDRSSTRTSALPILPGCTVIVLLHLNLLVFICLNSLVSFPFRQQILLRCCSMCFRAHWTQRFDASGLKTPNSTSSGSHFEIHSSSLFIPLGENKIKNKIKNKKTAKTTTRSLQYSVAFLLLQQETKIFLTFS